MTREARAFVRRLVTRDVARTCPRRTGAHQMTIRQYLRGAFAPKPQGDGWFGPFCTWIVIVAALNRGTDLAFASNEGRSQLSTWVNVIGNNTYGWLFITGAVLLIAAKVFGRIGPIVVCLALLAGVNFMYAIALFQGVFASPGPTTGWRFAGPPFLSTALAVGRLVSLIQSARRVPE